MSSPNRFKDFGVQDYFKQYLISINLTLQIQKLSVKTVNTNIRIK